MSKLTVDKPRTRTYPSARQCLVCRDLTTGTLHVRQDLIWYQCSVCSTEYRRDPTEDISTVIA